MQRRCTEHTCRRVFPIGHTAPVHCPYCGTAYPRIQPDPRSPRDTFGYSVRADFTGMPAVKIQPFFPECRAWPRRFPPQPLAVCYGISRREAQELCRRFRAADIPAHVITTWDARRQHLEFFRP